MNSFMHGPARCIIGRKVAALMTLMLPRYVCEIYRWHRDCDTAGDLGGGSIPTLTIMVICCCSAVAYSACRLKSGLAKFTLE